MAEEAEAPPRPAASGQAWKWAGVASVIAVIVVIAAFVVVEGDIGDTFIDVRDWVFQVVRRFGVAGSLALLYIEESGVPLPVPGDVYVTYLGHQARGSNWHLFASWLGVIAVVVAGSTNLYLISRRWGPRLVKHRLGRALHLDEHRMQVAHQWFQRWGVLAMIFGRHVPGFRVPLTVVAATVGFPYRLFVPSVAISTAIWAGVFIILGDRFGRGIAEFLSVHAWLYGVGTLIVVGLVVYVAIGVLRPDPRETKPSVPDG
jgi:membrane-associated protein